jgi:hypothetical protein
MKNVLNLAYLAVFLFAISLNGFAQDEEKKTVILITNATVFDGENEQLMEDTDILIEGNLIKEIAKNIKAPKGAEVIDVEGKYLVPGFSDAHSHITLNDELEYIIYSSQVRLYGRLGCPKCTRNVVARLHYHSRYGRPVAWPEKGN